MRLVNKLTGEVFIGVPHDVAVRYISFPHYKPQEAAVMRNFIRYGPLRGYWFFDVPLHTPQSLRLFRAADPLYRRESRLYVKRIDAVCITETTCWILEVKERLRPSGIGELAMYRDLFEEQYEVDRPRRMGYVYRTPDPVLYDVCARRGIARFQVGV